MTGLSCYAGRPVEFVQEIMRITTGRAANCLLRSLDRTGHASVAGWKWTNFDMRVLEIAVATWRVCTRPFDDVLVALPSREAWGAWLKDAAKVLEKTHADLRGNLSISEWGIIHSGPGLGKVWCFLGTGEGVPEPRGENGALVLAGFDSLSSEVVKQGQAKFVSPRILFTTVYKKP